MVNLEEYTCIGDSQLNRFCNYSNTDPSLCLPGRRIREIHQFVKRLDSLPAKLIVCVGTNDLRRGVDVQQLLKDFRAFIRHLLRRSTDIILLVTPIIPYLAGKPQHLERVRSLRDLACSFVPRLTVLDLGTWNERGLVKPHFFEERYFSGKPDNLHLNHKAFAFLVSLLRRL